MVYAVADPRLMYQFASEHCYPEGQGHFYFRPSAGQVRAKGSKLHEISDSQNLESYCSPVSWQAPLDTI